MDITMALKIESITGIQIKPEYLGVILTTHMPISPKKRDKPINMAIIKQDISESYQGRTSFLNIGFFCSLIFLANGFTPKNQVFRYFKFWQ